jgi:hypothetical protein
MVAARKTMKNIMTPMEKKPSKHPPLLAFFCDIPFIDPDKPATPNSRNKTEDR